MRFAEEEYNDHIMSPITKGEVEGVIKSMQKDKSLGRDNWTIDLFQHFFQLIRADLLWFVEKSRIKGQIYKLINSTFLALILKNDDP